MASLLGDADIVVMGLEPFGKTVSKLCPNIKMISKRSIGYDSVDLKECEKRGITVARTTGWRVFFIIRNQKKLLLRFRHHVLTMIIAASAEPI